MAMIETVLKAKIHRARVTVADIDYEGSIDIGRDLMEAAGIRPYERVLVANFTNGHRWWTYAVPADDGVVGLNGGGARMGVVGDIVTIFSYVHVAPEEAVSPKIVIVDEGNRVEEILEK
jgi:aspartate 1-decarboxylase